ncbi:MAG: SelB C-terminal domain-containing protein, partial [Armatimonadota bacterium]
VIGTYPQGVSALELSDRLRMDSVRVGDAIQELRDGGAIIGIGGLWFLPGDFADRMVEWLEALKEAHRERPKEVMLDAQSVFGLTGKPLERALDIMERRGSVRRSKTRVAHRDFRPELSPKQVMTIGKVVEACNHLSPRLTQIHRLSGDMGMPKQAVEKAVELGLQTGDLVEFSGRLTSREAVHNLLEKATKLLPRSFTVLDFKEITGLNRSDCVTYLDRWDELGFTVRDEDHRWFSDKVEESLGDRGLTDDDASD